MLSSRAFVLATKQITPKSFSSSTSARFGITSTRWFSSTAEKVATTSTQVEAAPKAKERPKEAKIAGVRTDGRSRRWFKEVGIEHFKLTGEEGWLITLDGRIIKTPKDNRLLIPTKPLALALAAEWDSHSDKIRPISMPLMTLASTAIDLIPEKRKTVIDSLMSHLNTDVVSVRSPVPALGRLQAAAHDPLVQWFSQYFKIPPLQVSQGLFIVTHPEETLTTIQWSLFHMDDWTLAGLDSLTNYTRSLVLSVALWKKKISIEDAIKAARMEEDYQIAKFGEVQGSHDIDQHDLRAKLGAATLFLHLIPQKDVQH